jgi:hypothetical protein
VRMMLFGIYYIVHSGRCYQHFSETSCSLTSFTQMGLFIIIEHVGILIILVTEMFMHYFYYIMLNNFI